MKMTPQEFVQWMEAQRRDMVKYQPAPEPEMRDRLASSVPPTVTYGRAKPIEGMPPRPRLHAVIAWVIALAVLAPLAVHYVPLWINGFIGPALALVALLCISFPGIILFIIAFVLLLGLAAWAMGIK